MKCPSCGAPAAQGDVICSKCDYVLDPSFFASDERNVVTHEPVRSDTPPGGSPGVVTPSQPTPVLAKLPSRPTAFSAEVDITNVQTVPPSPRVTVKSAALAEATTLPPDPPGVAATRLAATQILPPPGMRPMSSPAAERTVERAADRSATSRPLSLAPPSTALGANADAMANLEQVWIDFQRLRKELDRPDRIAFYGAVSQVLWLFLPWQETAREGSVVGVMTAGFVVLIGAVLAAGAIFYRKRDRTGRFDPMAPWLIQGLGACFMVGWCLFAIRNSWDARLVPGLESLEMPASRPAFGAHVALAAAVASLLGTLWGLKNKLS